jgi:hypothetical protein
MRMLPQVAAATTLVVLVPVALVWWLRADGIVASAWLCVLLAMALSIVVSGIGSAYWKRRHGSELAVFSELLLWGWLRRVRLERRIANTVERLADQSPDTNATDRGDLLRALASALDAQDPYTEGHSRRVARHAAMVARELGLSDEDVQRVGTAAAMHDVGKLSIPPALLAKPDTLTLDEFEIVKRSQESSATPRSASTVVDIHRAYAALTFRSEPGSWPSPIRLTRSRRSGLTGPPRSTSARSTIYFAQRALSSIPSQCGLSCATTREGRGALSGRRWPSSPSVCSPGCTAMPARPGTSRWASSRRRSGASWRSAWRPWVRRPPWASSATNRPAEASSRGPRRPHAARLAPVA